MSLENIMKKIEAETTAEVNNILKDAQKRAKEITAKFKKKIVKELAETQSQGKKRITIMRNIHLSEARRNARRITLSAKEELIKKCFNQAKERLRTMTGDEYRTVMVRLIKESQDLVGDNGVATLTRDEDKSILSSFPKITVKPELASGLGGLIMESVDGKVIVDNTFDAILERKKDDIRTEVAKILFPESEEE